MNKILSLTVLLTFSLSLTALACELRGNTVQKCTISSPLGENLDVEENNSLTSDCKLPPQETDQN